MRWRETPSGHWLVILASGDRIIWAETMPYIYLLEREAGRE